MFFPLLGLRRVVIGHAEGVLLNPHVAFQTAEEISGEVDRIPLIKRRPQTLAQLMDERLGQEGHGHLSVPDVEVQGARAFPAEVLIKAKELLDLPTVGKVGG